MPGFLYTGKVKNYQRVKFYRTNILTKYIYIYFLSTIKDKKNEKLFIL